MNIRSNTIRLIAQTKVDLIGCGLIIRCQFLAIQQSFDMGCNYGVVVRLRYEVVGPTFQALDYILRIGKDS